MRKVEELRTLNLIVQKADYKTKGNWMARNITRDMALPLSWVLLHTPITANQVTLISLIVGVFGCFLFATGGALCVLLGALLLQIWYLLDHVDGHIARYKGQSSLTGVYFDYITHYVVHAAIFIGIGAGVTEFSGQGTFLVMGLVAALGVTFLNLVYDVMYKTYFYRFTRAKVITVRENKISRGEENSSKGTRGVKKLFSLAHKCCEVHVLMNIVTLLAVIAFLFQIDTWKIFIVFYSFLCVGVGLFKNVHFILSKVPDSKMREMFEVSD